MQARSLLPAAALCLLAAVSGWSQQSRGTILGRVSDPSGAVVPGAQVVVTNTAMGTKTTVSTNAEGMYLAPLLMPGIYKIEASSAGFKTAVRDSIELRVADRLDISFTLEIGTTGEQVMVTAEAPMLNSESASLGTVIDSKRVGNLPLSYGNPFLLIGLSAGVTFNGSVRLDRPFEPTHIVNFAMGGTQGNLNDITIDGAPTTSRANGNQVTASYVPPTDIVQEFKVQTATFDAQFGQTQGGVTNMSIKSGTNEFHGTARYQFYRPALWANDFFNNSLGKPKNPFSLDSWGGSFGGPVRIPKVYDGRNKTFFMFGYEGIHDARPRHDDSTNTVPTPAMHNGDFSALLVNSSYTIYDPNTRVVKNGHWTQSPFPGNVIPQSRFDPVGKAILDYYPTTEKSQGDQFGVGNYQDNSVTERAKYYNITARVDQNIGERQRFFVRYSAYIRNSTYNNYFGESSPFVGTQFWFYSKEAAFDHVFTISPTMFLNTRYSYNRFVRGSDGNANGEGFDLSKLGFSQQYIGQVPKDIARFPRINLTGYISNGFTGENRPTNNQSVAAIVSKAAGVHSVRFGAEYRVYQQADKFFSNQQTGNFTFGNTYTRGSDTGSLSSGSPGSIGQSVAALLLGLPSATITRAADYIEQSGVWGLFVQDDWKVTPKLTLNVGLRYELETALHERYNRSILTLDQSYAQPFGDAAIAKYPASLAAMASSSYPLLPASAFAVNGGLTFAGLNGNNGSLYQTPKDVFLPRFGLAYQLNNKTVIRSGFGMFAGFLGQRRGDVQQPGFSSTTNMVLLTGQEFLPLTTLSNPFNNGIEEPQGSAGGYSTYLGQGFTFFDQHPKIPMSMRWELSIQRQFGSFVLETAYVGNKTNHIQITRNINALPAQYWSYLPTRDNAWNTYYGKAVPNPFKGLVNSTTGTYTGTTTGYRNLLYPLPQYGSSAINTTENTGYSWYHSLQISLTKRFSQGYTIGGNYTFAKWMEAVNLLNAIDPAPVREISSADAPHRFNISGVWELPFGRGKALAGNVNPVVSHLVSGWQLSGIWNLQSGFPLAWGNVIYYGNPADILLPLGERNPNHWFNTAGFETASGNQLLGNQYRTWPFRFSTLRRQRINNTDLAILKNTRIAEGKDLQFRAEALNAFNHAYFPSPNMTVTASQSAANKGFGQLAPSNMDNYARRIQLTLKLIF